MRYSDTDSAPRSRSAARIFSAAASSEPAGGIRIGVRERQLGDRVEGHHVEMHVRDLVAGDDHADPARSQRGHLRPPDRLRHLEQVRREGGLEIDPVVDLGPRHDERVAGVHRVDRQEDHALLVAPHEHAGDLTVDDPREDGL